MSIGLKIALTGFVFFAVALTAIGMIGRKPPSMWVAATLLAAFFGGIAALLVGTMMVIWQ